MAFPVFHASRYPGRDALAIPDYFSGRVLINEWAKEMWVDVIMNAAGTAIMLVSRVLKGTDAPNFNTIDIKVGPDGHWYTIEYNYQQQPVSDLTPHSSLLTPQPSPLIPHPSLLNPHWSSLHIE
jgi:hypothetical protein